MQGIPENLVQQAVRRAKNRHCWTAQCANGLRVDWDVAPGCSMGEEDLVQWVRSLVAKGGGFPVRIQVNQTEPTERAITSGTIWKLGDSWQDDSPGPSLRSLVPLDDGIDVDEDTREEADSAFERLVLMAVERPAIISNFVSGVVDIATPAIDTALAPIVETLIDQVSERSAEKVEARMRSVLEEMLEFADEDEPTNGHDLGDLRDREELLGQAEELEELEEEEEAILLARLEIPEELEELPKPDPEQVEAEIEACWKQREALELELEHVEV